MIQKEQLQDEIYHLRFPSQQKMNVALLRMQEFNENKHFKGKVFSLEDFITWSIKDSGKFSYFEDVLGINFEGTVLPPFRQGRFDKLSEFEEEVLEVTCELNPKKSYIIGTFQDKELKHEIAHGLFATIPEYRRRATKIINSLPQRDRRKMNEHLSDLDYHPSVWLTETNSYLLDRAVLPYNHQMRKLNELYKEYVK